MATTFIGSAATPYLSGSDEIKQSAFTIENSGSESPVIVKIRRMVTQAPSYGRVGTMPLFRSYRLTSLPTGGTELDKTPFDTLSGSNASVIVRSSCSVGIGNGLNGIISTPITSSLPGGPVWQQYCNRRLEFNETCQWKYIDNNNLPLLVNNNPFILRANEAIGIEVEGFVGTQNPVADRYFVQVLWEEETI